MAALCVQATLRICRCTNASKSATHRRSPTSVSAGASGREDVAGDGEDLTALIEGAFDGDERTAFLWGLSDEDAHGEAGDNTVAHWEIAAVGLDAERELVMSAPWPDSTMRRASP